MAGQAENPDERLAREWLAREGYDDVERLTDDPPDFVVNGDCGVEVTRLSQRIVVGAAMCSKAEEQARKPLTDQIAKVIEQLGPPGNEGRSWAIDCEYDFSTPLPDRRTVAVQVSEALAPLLKPHDIRVVADMHSEHLDFGNHAGETSYLRIPNLCLACGIRLELTEFAHQPASFLLNDVSSGEGIGLTAELANGIRNGIRAKSRKIRHRDRLRNYGTWWLVLVDHIGIRPMHVLSEHELSAVRNQDFDFWDRVVVVSSNNAKWHCDLRPR